MRHLGDLVPEAQRSGRCARQGRCLEQGSGGLVSVHLPAVLSQAESELLGMVTGACNDTYHVERLAAAAAATLQTIRVY